MVKIYFGLLQTKVRFFTNSNLRFSCVSTYDFSTLYLYLACNEKQPFFPSEQPKRFKFRSCQKVFDALHYLLDDIFIRFVL